MRRAPGKAATHAQWGAFVRAVAGGHSQATIAQSAGITQPTASRWLSGETGPTVAAAVRLARAYGVSPVQALMAAGFLTKEDTEIPPFSPRQASTEALVAELARRHGNGHAAS